MIESLIRFSVERRMSVILLTAVLAVLGCAAMFRTPMDAVPDLSENQVLVFTAWQGHGPLEIEERITRPVSRQLQGIDGVRVVRGSSDMGYSLLHVIFEDRVAFADGRRLIQDKLSAMQELLPEGVQPSLASEGIATGQIYWYTVEGRGRDLSDLRRMQDTLIAPQLSTVRGVAEVASVGGFLRELHIQADATQLAARGLSASRLVEELERFTGSAGGQVLQKGMAEFVVQLESESRSIPGNDVAVIREWENRVLPCPDGTGTLLKDVASISFAPAPRRGVFEKDGSECVAGIVHLRFGHNPLEVTDAVRRKLIEVSAGLPDGIRVVPCYDQTPLIRGAIRTVSRTLVEALLIAAICVLLVLRHFRTWLLIAMTLPLCVLGTFLAMAALRSCGVIDIQTNIMSLAGIVISIGVLVDSSIVMTENVMHRLRQRFGDQPVTGDVRTEVISACQTVGRPLFFSILVMLVSFAPVFALKGIDGRMYAPLAWTKSLALATAAVLAVTLVPALCSVLIRGRMRDESESAIVRSVLTVYRPILSSLMVRPAPLILILCETIVFASAPLGNQTVFLGAVFASLVTMVLIAKTRRASAAAFCTILISALIADRVMTPLATELRMPLNEGVVMDMPITIPRASVTQSADDLKARNMVLCRFPEIRMVSGKAGRADTPFDPAPLDMIETMIEFRPVAWWPQRRLRTRDANELSRIFVDRLVAAGMIEPVAADSLAAMTDAAMFRFDAVSRETAFQLIEVFLADLQEQLGQTAIEAAAIRWNGRGELTRPVEVGDIAALQNTMPAEYVHDLTMMPSEETVATFLRQARPLLDRCGLFRTKNATGQSPATGLAALLGIDHSPSFDSRFVADKLQRAAADRWATFIRDLNQTLRVRAAGTFVHLLSDELFAAVPIIDESLRDVRTSVIAIRTEKRTALNAGEHHHGLAPMAELPIVDPHPIFDSIRKELQESWASRMTLDSQTPELISKFGGEMDLALQMPGWTNVWTKPIQNRVDMLATGVNSEVGIRVLGSSLDDVVATSEEIASNVREIPGASDVVADPIRGKGIIQVVPDPLRAAALGVSLGDISQAVDLAFSGRVVTDFTVQGHRIPVRLSLKPDEADVDEETLRRLPIARSFMAVNSTNGDGQTQSGTVPLQSVATVQITEGPATIKSENGWLRNYVRLNVRNRDPLEFVEEARRVVAARLKPPQGIFVEWTGQFEHATETRRTLMILMPVVVLLIFMILLATYQDVADAAMVLLTAPGALAGGVLCQWLFGYPFSVAVGVGYIACFGMAASTGIVMLVYLREAVETTGGLERISLEELKAAVFRGAVHRLRPKLLTEATTLLSLAPMLWSTGVGAEIIRPMAAPVLGGILVADEVIDLLLPVLFYHVRRRRWEKIHNTNSSFNAAHSAAGLLQQDSIL